MSGHDPYAPRSPGESPARAPELPPHLIDASTRDVLDWVGGDEARARVALGVERSGAQRKTLMGRLERIASARP